MLTLELLLELFEDSFNSALVYDENGMCDIVSIDTEEYGQEFYHAQALRQYVLKYEFAEFDTLIVYIEGTIF